MTFLEGFDSFVTSTIAPIATGWNDEVAGWELHPLKTHAFARRTEPEALRNDILVWVRGAWSRGGRFSRGLMLARLRDFDP